MSKRPRGKYAKIQRLLVLNFHHGILVIQAIGFAWKAFEHTLAATTCSKLTMETLEQGVKYVQS